MGLLEKLATAKQVKLSSCIGVYISLDAIYAAEVRTDSPAVRLERFVKIPIAHLRGEATDIGRASAMHAEFFLNEALWLAPLQEAFKQVQWDTRKIHITLSPEFAIFRHFMLPYVARRFWNQSIPLEAKKYVPFPFDESVFDFYAYPFNPKEARSRLGVLFAITNKKIADAIKTGISKAGFDLMGIDVASVSVTAAFAKFGATGGEGKAFAHFDANVAHLLLTHNGIPLLFREVSFDDVQATERRRLDVRGSVDFINKQLGNTVFSEILVSGSNLELWQNVIAEDSKLDVKSWDPKAVVNLQEMEWGTIAAIGCTLRYMPDQTSLVDLTDRERVNVDEKKAQLFVSLIIGAIAGVLLILSGFAFLKTTGLTSTIDKLQSETPSIPEFEGLDSSQIQDLVSNMSTKQTKLSMMLSGQDLVTPKLLAFVEMLPPEAWLTAFSYDRQLVGGMSSFSVSGNIHTGDPKRDMDIVSEIKEKIKKNPAFSVYSGADGRISSVFTKAKTMNGASQFEIRCDMGVI